MRRAPHGITLRPGSPRSVNGATVVPFKRLTWIVISAAVLETSACTSQPAQPPTQSLVPITVSPSVAGAIETKTGRKFNFGRKNSFYRGSMVRTTSACTVSPRLTISFPMP